MPTGASPSGMAPTKSAGPKPRVSARRRLNTAACWLPSWVTNAKPPSGETATSMPPAPPAGLVSVPSTAPGWPCSARATLITTAPLPEAANRYRPSGVSASPTAPPGTASPVRAMVRTLTGASAGPRRSISTELMSATKAHRPSGVTTTPNGVPGTLTMAVRTPLSVDGGAVEVLQPGEDSATP